MKSTALKTCSIATAALFALTAIGCTSSTHEIIDAGESCTSCHPEKQVYDVSEPKEAIACGSAVKVETSAESIAVCRPIFISENGSSYVPEMKRQVKTENGSASIELGDGIFALCVVDGNQVKKSQIVIVDEDAAEATITL